MYIYVFNYLGSLSKCENTNVEEYVHYIVHFLDIKDVSYIINIEDGFGFGFFESKTDFLNRFK